MSNEELIAFLRENLRIELDSRDDYTGGTGGMDGPLYERKMVIRLVLDGTVISEAYE